MCSCYADYAHFNADLHYYMSAYGSRCCSDSYPSQYTSFLCKGSKLQNKSCSHLFYVFWRFNADHPKYDPRLIFTSLKHKSWELFSFFSANLPHFWSIRWLMIEQHQHEIIISSNLTCSQHFWFDHNFDDNIWHFVRRFVLIIKWEFSLG